MLTDTFSLTDTERSQLDRKELARGSWKQGQFENALLILETVLAEEMTPRVAVECWVTHAAFTVDSGDLSGSFRSLAKAAPLIEHGSSRVQGSFYLQRARANKEAGNLDAALMDYSGAVAYFRAAGDLEWVGICVKNLATIYILFHDLDQALKNALEAIEIFQATGSHQLCQAYDTLALVRLAEGRMELSLSALAKAFELVGENDTWRMEFLETERKIKTKLRELLDIRTVADLDAIQTEMIRSALIKHGRESAAGEEVGLSRKGIEYLINHREALVSFRRVPRKRRKSIIKKKK